MPRTIDYRVAIDAPWKRLIHVTMRIPLAGPRPALDLAMAAWTPGSYRVRDFARHVQDLAARDGASGAALACEKLDKQTWRVSADTSTIVEVSYAVYANEWTVRTSHLDERHAYWNGAASFLRVLGEEDRPARVTIAGLPAGWRVATGLDRAPGGAGVSPGTQGPAEHVYAAKDFDELVDSPFACGAMQEAEFQVVGVRHRVVMDGENNGDLARIAEDAKKIVEAEVALFHDDGSAPPYPHYTFLVECVPEGTPGGGLEHARSTTLMWNRFRFRPREKYEDFLALLSHELFHLWNGKRIRPNELGPFDYRGEVYTRALWVVEGITSYYDELMLRRAEIWDAETYLKKIVDHVEHVEATPGRRHQSLEEASFDAWVKYYQRHEHSVNNQISYYEKGQLVAWLLDLEIRARSGGARSLDDVMRRLWRAFRETGRGYDLPRVEALAAEAAGADLAGFFEAYTRGTADLDYDRHLAPFGLRMVEEPKKDGEKKPGDELAASREDPTARAWLGAVMKADGARTMIAEVLEGSPAQEQGLCAGDELLAIDGFRVAAHDVEARLHERKPGDRARLVAFRGDRLIDVAVTLGAKRWVRRAIRPRPDATDAQRALYKGWLGEAFPEKPG